MNMARPAGRAFFVGAFSLCGRLRGRHPPGMEYLRKGEGVGDQPRLRYHATKGRAARYMLTP